MGREKGWVVLGMLFGHFMVDSKVGIQFKVVLLKTPTFVYVY